MILGIVILAMIAGSLAAVMALFAGQSILFALVVYSGCGTVCAVLVVLTVAAREVLATRKPGGPAAPEARAA